MQALLRAPTLTLGEARGIVHVYIHCQVSPADDVQVCCACLSGFSVQAEEPQAKKQKSEDCSHVCSFMLPRRMPRSPLTGTESG